LQAVLPLLFYGTWHLDYDGRMRPTVWWETDRLIMIDQRRLPHEETYVECRTAADVADAIKTMVIRGAPAIGVAAAFGLVLAVRAGGGREGFEAAATLLASTRPTAVNLFWAIERMRQRYAAAASTPATTADTMLKEASAIETEDVAACRKIGDLGAALLPSPVRLLTHCNAGALATAGYGTALGVVRSASRAGKLTRVFADETRPYLQGARLTAWELHRDGIPTTLITDSMAGHMMSRREVDAIVVGADRIAGNGDVANKIGTYTLAVLAHENGLPFYVAAPVSTIDLKTPSGAQIPIEERSPDEVTGHAGTRMAPLGIEVRNPAFDVTPHRFVTAIICEAGVARAPYTESLAALVASATC
jgi:methylthioribose-1-phosphate isomerase